MVNIRVSMNFPFMNRQYFKFADIYPGKSGASKMHLKRQCLSVVATERERVIALQNKVMLWREDAENG